MDVDRLLATHCSSVFLRRKPAALFSAPRPLLASSEMERALAHHGLCHRVLCDRCAHVLLLVYDSALLTQQLARAVIRQTLARIGYPEGGLGPALEHLSARVAGTEGFPHEIGFFLGYPPEDVLGFMRYRGRHCKHCGLWKVYGDVPRAKAMFAEYHACRRQVLHHLENGGSLYNLPTSPAV
ncbi:DUF3793 family protein [Eubacteriales bacterium OttesenSCG-928-A19]|nr:DUF3793 family protein [Eubacteriales bacterium OttesenSCG-928-A19]